jgi:hypothetical protein
MAAKTETETAVVERRGEYPTYAPKGEKCVDCKKPFKSLDRVWRVALERQSGAPALGPYRHYEPCT